MVRGRVIHFHIVRKSASHIHNVFNGNRFNRNAFRNTIWFDHTLDGMAPLREIAPLPELMDRKKRDIMERKGDKEDENKRQKQQKESSAAAL